MLKWNVNSKGDSMGKRDGYVAFSCDRCDKVEYLERDSKDSQRWHEIRHYTADGVEVSRTLCEQCYADYKVKASAHDAEFNDFMLVYRKEK